MPKEKKLDLTKRYKGRERNVADVEIMPKKEERTPADRHRRVYKADSRKRAINSKLGSAEDALMYDEMNGEVGWSERDFVVPASSTRGDTQKLYFSVMPQMRSLCSQIIQNRVFPYRSIQDLLRHALYRHLVWLATLDRNVPSTMKQVQIIIDQSKESTFKVQFVELFDTLREEVRELRDFDMEDMIRERVKVVHTQLQEIDDRIWRTKYLREFEKEFGKWIKKPRSRPQKKS